MGGWTPAHYAAHSGNVAALSVLVAAKANVSIKDHVGQTALEVAQSRLEVAMQQDSKPRNYELVSRLEQCCKLLSLAASCEAACSLQQQEQELISLRQRVAELEASLGDKDVSHKKGASRGKRAGRKVKAQLLRKNQDKAARSGSGDEPDGASEDPVSAAAPSARHKILEDERAQDGSDDNSVDNSVPNTASELMFWSGV